MKFGPVVQEMFKEKVYGRTKTDQLKKSKKLNEPLLQVFPHFKSMEARVITGIFGQWGIFGHFSFSFLTQMRFSDINQALYCPK